MDFILDKTSDTDNEEQTSELTTLKEELDEVKALVTDNTDKINSLDTETNALSLRVDRKYLSLYERQDSINDALDTLNTHLNNLNNTVNTDKLIARETSSSSAKINSLEVDNVTFNNPIEADISSDRAAIDDLNADTAYANNVTVATKLTAKNIQVNDEFTVDTIHADTVNTDSLNVNNGTANTLQVTDKIIFNGVTIKQVDVQCSGKTNGYLHKLDVRADGIFIMKLQNASIVVGPGNISSNCLDLYAAYEADGVWSIYLDTDVDCQALVIGDANITASMVLKSSIRRNVDSNGQPNGSNAVKVAVVSGLPSVGQRNVIYVVLGDCAYYCDGQYFYEMASKKRS